MANLEALLEQLMADDLERPFQDGTPREAELPWISGKADALIGMRRSGKTWKMRQQMKRLTAAGAPRESLLYLSLEDERLWQLDSSSLQLIVDVFYRRAPALRDRECAFFLDEIQIVEGWERFVRRLMDTENIHVCISGSSSKLLSQELRTSMRGRSIATEIFPFSFREVLAHAGVAFDSAARPGKRQRSTLEHAFGDYLERGGFPEIQAVDAGARVRILQEYLDAVILRDVVERHQVSNTVALRRLIRRIINAPASLTSVHRLYNDFRSQGISVSKDTLYALLDHLEDAFLLFSVPIHTASERAKQSNPRKMYPVDTGLVTACADLPGRGLGQLLETCIFLDLRRTTREISYFRNDDGTEVDFVVGSGKSLELIQVSADITSSDTRNRELTALGRAMSALGVSEATIVTHSAEETLKTHAGTIRVVPAWYWLSRAGGRGA
ncbi:MAG TPA: ATP-binding protein [Polyangiaceae bacterium]|nr:ATP-binding protein [Polyangiaceae bacterium]